MVIAGKVMCSWVACLRSLCGLHQDVGGLFAVGIGEHGRFLGIIVRVPGAAQREAVRCRPGTGLY